MRSAVLKKSEKPKQTFLVRKSEKRQGALFIDGVALDRASRRIGKKVDFAKLLTGVTPGFEPIIARYYTIIPLEDDSRHRAFLDVVRLAGFEVIVKRLPPIGSNRVISTDLEMACDLLAFGLESPPPVEDDSSTQKRVVSIVCPSRELVYPISMLNDAGVDTISVDFGAFNGGDVLKACSKWINLTESDGIWL